MNRFRIIAVGTVLTIAQFASAQQPSTGAANSQAQSQETTTAMSAVDQHLKFLTEQLSLTTEQQTHIRPVLKQMLDDRQKLEKDTSLSDGARQEKEKALHEKADKQARKFLNDDQKQKLDALEQQPHP